MKKLLTLFLITALTLSCLAGCGSSEPAEKENASEVETQQTEETSTEADVVESDAETEVTETEVEETTDEVVVPEMELGTVTMQSEDGSAKIELTYNATFFDYEEVVANQGNFYLNENDIEYMEKYEWPENIAGGGQIFFCAGYSVQDYYDERIGLCVPYDIDVTEMEQITIKDKTGYLFREDFYDEAENMMPYIVFEVENNVVVFLLPSGNWTNEDFIRDIGEFFIDAKVVE